MTKITGRIPPHLKFARVVSNGKIIILSIFSWIHDNYSKSVNSAVGFVRGQSFSGLADHKLLCLPVKKSV